ncbi:peptide/nickel transport system substrate-binding protein [Rhizobiales bacterium GAS191]|nr:peptide/nickel transport system substrate-binding protein [Rhizobiales bacterium GAS191]
MTMITRRSALAAGAALTMLPRIALAQGAPRRGGTLRISVDQAAGVLNPLLTRVNPEYMLSELLYSNLTRLTTKMEVEPDLAESWSANADVSQWTFVLRPNLRFHDGSPCTAKDVASTFKAILDPKTASPARTNVGPIAEVVALDDRTALFKLSTPYADLPTALAYTNARIIPSAIAEGDLTKLAKTAIGTGPFKLVSYEPDRLIVVQRNETYYDAARPYIDRLEIVVYPDPTAESSALISGDTDLIANTPPTEFPRFAGASGVTPLRIPSGQFLNVNMGCDQKPFSDVRVRQALALTIDRKAMVDFCAQGYGTPGNDVPMNAAYRFYKAVAEKAPDIAKAKQLLADAGYPNGLDLKLIASDTPSTRTSMAVSMREMAKPAGFRIEVQTMPHATYLDQVWKKGPFYVGFYNMQASADAIFALLYISNAAWNETRWNNTDFDKLVGEARGTTDEARRRALYGEAQQLMHDQVPSVIPVFFDLLAAKRNYVQGYALHPRGSVFRLDHAWLAADAPKRG